MGFENPKSKGKARFLRSISGNLKGIYEFPNARNIQPTNGRLVEQTTAK
jgi:hypothetical protein